MEATTADIYLSSASRIIKLLASALDAGDNIFIPETIAKDILHPLLKKHIKVVE